MGIQDRDYVRERRLRWDERSGEMRLDDVSQSDELAGRWGLTDWAVMLATAAGGFALAGAAFWFFRNPHVVVDVATAPRTRATADAVAGAEVPRDAENPVLIGTVTRVLDGDTLEVQLSSGPIRVRFDSVDAPEKNQPWGQEARAALTSKLGHREVALDVVTQDQYERMVSTVYLGDENVNEWMVRQGHAWAYRQYLKDPQYCSWEAEARAGSRGIWALPRDRRHAPWEFRTAQRGRGGSFTDYSHETVESCIAAIRKKPVPVAEVATAAPSTLPAASGCRIKGNISGSGKIYHTPTSASYARTKIDETKGERWFCSEEAARAAGWRSPRG